MANSRKNRACLALPLGLLETMADALKVLAHRDRLRVVELLDIHTEMPVKDIVERTSLPQSAVSNHLSKMKQAGLLKSERRGKERWYSIANPNAVTIINCIRTKHRQ